MGAPLLSLAAPALIHFFKDPIDKIGHRIKDPEFFETIAKACLNQQAFLFVGHEGFAVLKPIFRNELPGTLIWVAHSTTSTNRAEYLQEFEGLAHAIDSTFIELWTVRQGFQRVLPAHGFTSRPDMWCDHPITVWTKQL